MDYGRERIAVTGVGLVSALGTTACGSFGRLIGGERGLGPVTLFDVAGQRSELAAEVPGLRIADVAPRDVAEIWSRSDALAMLAALDALRSAGLASGSARFSLAVGATTGGMYEAEAILAQASEAASLGDDASRLASFPLSASAQRLSEALGRVERAATVCSACSSGANAIVQAVAWLRRGEATCVLAGGAEALCRLTFAGFNALGATDPRGCRPFDAERAGLTLGEGAAFLVLERESDAWRRGARVLAWLSGWAAGAEAHHITNPEPSGAIPAHLIRAALDRAGLSPADIDYVNAHGTGTVHNDAMEARALRQALGPELERIRVSSCKGQLGHTLGASGGVEAAVTVLAIDSGQLPPTGGLVSPDESFGLCHVTGAGEACAVRAALSNSFGFGGADAVLLFEHPASSASRRATAGPARAVVTAAASWSGSGLCSGIDVAAGGGSVSQADAVSASRVASELLEPARSRRFDSLAALAATAAERVLHDARLEPSGVGLALGTGFGNVQRSARFLQRLLQSGPRLVSPAEFPHLLPSSASGNASVYLGLSGPVLSVTDIGADAEAAVGVAFRLIELQVAQAMVAGGVVADDPVASRLLDPLFEDRVKDASEGAACLLLESAAHARQRGARVMAEVRQTAHAFGGLSDALRSIAAPANPERSVVLHWGRARELDAALGGSAWKQAERRDARCGAGSQQAGSGLALAVGVGLVADSVADEVLVLASARGRAYATHLARPSGGSGDPRA